MSSLNNPRSTVLYLQYCTVYRVLCTVYFSNARLRPDEVALLFFIFIRVRIRPDQNLFDGSGSELTTRFNWIRPSTFTELTFYCLILHTHKCLATKYQQLRSKKCFNE